MRRFPLDRIENAHVRMVDQLTRHLADMADLHQQVEQARLACGQHADGAELFGELAETLDQHRTLIAQQVRELSVHAPVLKWAGRPYETDVV